MNKNSVLLEVDQSLIGNKLLVNEEDNFENDGLQLLLNQDRILVQPTPGLCIKTWKAESDEKLFINLCHTDKIPQPIDVSDEELINLFKSMENDDDFEMDNSKFRFPMSIGELHKECDKGGRPCDVCDVAVNTTFFNNKILKNDLFRGFVVSMSIEAVSHKHNIPVISYQTKKPVIMKNSKFMGKIKSQSIQKREKDNNNPYKSISQPKKLIEEISPSDKPLLKKNVISKPPVLNASSLPYQIFMDSESAAAKRDVPKLLTVNILIKEPILTSSKGLILDIGEDRILLTATANIFNKRILVDFFLPYNIIQEECNALFNSSSQVLTITLPVAA